MVFCVFLETWKLQSSFIVTAWKRSISTTFQNFQERKLYRFGMTWVRVNNERTFSLGKIKWFERRINYLLPPLDWLTRKLKKKKYKGGDKEIKARKGRIEGKKIRDNTRWYAAIVFSLARWHCKGKWKCHQVHQTEQEHKSCAEDWIFHAGAVRLFMTTPQESTVACHIVSIKWQIKAHTGVPLLTVLDKHPNCDAWNCGPCACDEACAELKERKEDKRTLNWHIVSSK